MGNNEKITVLVVDDSDIIKHALKNFFREYHFDVYTCSDGLEGIQMAKNVKPDLIFLDLMMPNLDGIKMLKILKVLDELKDIPVVVISGNTSRINVLKALEAGANKVLSKPLHKENIKMALKEILGEEQLSKSKKADNVNIASDASMIEGLKKIFYQNFKNKIPALKEYISQKNVEKAHEIVHQLKGGGTTAGFPKITELAIRMEENLKSGEVEWKDLDEKFNELQKIFSEIELKQAV